MSDRRTCYHCAGCEEKGRVRPPMLPQPPMRAIRLCNEGRSRRQLRLCQQVGHHCRQTWHWNGDNLLESWKRRTGGALVSFAQPREGVTRVSHRQQRESIVVRSRLTQTQPPCVARRRYFKITLRLAISHEFRGLRPLLVLVLTGTHPRRIGRGRRACSRSHHSMMHALLTVDEHVSGGCSYERYVLGARLRGGKEACKVM
jgi:hypothetical protein